MNDDFYTIISEIIARLSILERYAGGGGGGESAVSSVNGQTGSVVLDADDISDALTTKKFTNATEKTKLAGIEDGAQVNVNADWNAVSGDAQILNKPSIPTQYTDEEAQDAVGNAVGNGLNYDDSTGAISIDEQILPVKATGAEIDTGTDDDKFATALALANSHKIPTVTPGTANNVLASNATDWVSANLLTLFNSEVRPTFWTDTFWTINQSLWARNMLLFAMINGDQNDWCDDQLAGNLTNGASLVTGMKGVANTAIEFEPHGGGGTDEFIWWSHSTRQDIYNEISLIFLVKPTALPADYGARIINKGDNSSFQVDLVPSGNIRWKPFVGGVGQEQWSSSDDILVGEWNWVICSRRAFDGMQVIYTKNTTNGIRERREIKTAGNMNNNTNTIQAGAIEGWLGFNGLISNIFILDRFLTRLEALNFLNNVIVL